MSGASGFACSTAIGLPLASRLLVLGPQPVAPQTKSRAIIIEGREEAGPTASPRRWERWWRCPSEGWATLRHPLWIRAERAHHEITLVIIEGREGGRPGIGEGRLRRGPSGEGEVTKIEVVIEEGQGAAGTRWRPLHGGARVLVGGWKGKTIVMHCFHLMRK